MGARECFVMMVDMFTALGMDNSFSRNTEMSEATNFDRSAIVPRLKHTNFLAYIRQIPGIQPDDMPVTQPLVGDLLVTYALDLPNQFQMFTARDMRQFGMTLAEVHATAIANLCKKIPEVQQAGESPLIILATGEDMDACLLLLDEVWDRYVDKVPGELVVAVPARDAVFITGSKSDAGMQVVRQASADVFSKAGNHSLTTDLLTRRNGVWEVFEKGTPVNVVPMTKQMGDGESSRVLEKTSSGWRTPLWGLLAVVLLGALVRCMFSSSTSVSPAPKAQLPTTSQIPLNSSDFQGKNCELKVVTMTAPQARASIVLSLKEDGRVVILGGTGAANIQPKEIARWGVDGHYLVFTRKDGSKILSMVSTLQKPNEFSGMISSGARMCFLAFISPLEALQKIQ